MDRENPAENCISFIDLKLLPGPDQEGGQGIRKNLMESNYFIDIFTFSHALFCLLCYYLQCRLSTKDTFNKHLIVQLLREISLFQSEKATNLENFRWFPMMSVPCLSVICIVKFSLKSKS